MELDCQECGACCFSTLPTYVAVSGADYARLADDAPALTEFHGNRCYMRMHEGHCAALVIDPAAGAFACGVYAHRPSICRELARGSASCEAERIQKRPRAQQVLALVARPTTSR